MFHKSKGVQRKSQNITHKFIDPKRVGQMTQAWGTCLSNSSLAAAGDVADVALHVAQSRVLHQALAAVDIYDMTWCVFALDFRCWLLQTVVGNVCWTNKKGTFVQKVHDRVWDFQVQKATIMSLQVVDLQVIMEATSLCCSNDWIVSFVDKNRKWKFLYQNFK